MQNISTSYSATAGALEPLGGDENDNTHSRSLCVAIDGLANFNAAIQLPAAPLINRVSQTTLTNHLVQLAHQAAATDNLSVIIIDISQP